MSWLALVWIPIVLVGCGVFLLMDEIDNWNR